MTDKEKIILEIFLADVETFEAVQKIAKERIEKERDMFIRNRNLRKDKNPLDVGTQVQIFDEALLLTEQIFKDLRQYHKKVETVETNPAR